ncbi:type VI secretion protein, VC_A0110 family [Marinospirillum celere]|uniref:Type VI secretion protein, VC_A0110 family n=1 Tax=Marinospirillum celere TaxID=1122252 RepID=A0A1I1H467_9GAMM|nr:type VI secretion system baseplate subunit TssF [Marinospirillum celere]SFC18807.1 type VI secretion protein, VC_A0110 family [Marinospirillum celere]
MFDRYYRQELQQLRSLAQEYAEKEPELARHLVPGSDPDVERLLEGVAFLTAGLRDQLDREAPQLTRNLLAVTAPDSLQPLVSSCLVEFLPRKSLKSPLPLPAGTPLGGSGKQGTPVTFTSLEPCRVLPLSVTSCHQEEAVRGPTGKKFIIELQATEGDLGELLGEHPLRLQLSGNLGPASDLYWLLLKASPQLDVWIDGHLHASETPAAIQPRPAVFSKQLLPGEAALAQYLHAPESALGLELNLKSIEESTQGKKLALHFWVDESRLLLPAFSAKNLHLNSVLASNQFTRWLPAFLRNDHLIQQPLNPKAQQGEHLLLQDLTQLQGTYENQDKSHDYLPYWQVNPQQEKQAHAYQLNYSYHPVSDLPQISLVLAKGEEVSRGRKEMLKAQALCNNGPSASGLLPGDLNQHLQGTPEQLDFRNLTTSTQWKPPALDAENERQQLARLSVQKNNIFDYQGLMARLQHLSEQVSPDETRQNINNKKLSALLALKVENREKLLQQSLYRGLHLQMKINAGAFSSQGDALIFCQRLEEFFSHQAPINHFTALEVHETKTGEDYLWPAKLGPQQLK